MTAANQQIAIASSCGWRWMPADERHGLPHYPHWMSPLGYVQPDHEARESAMIHPPDYLTDLNAMHEAEKILDPLGKDGAYEYWLRTICHVPERESAKGRYFYRASAAQRAEAFLRALNLWKE